MAVAIPIEPSETPTEDLMTAVFEATLEGLVEHDLVADRAEYSPRWRALLGYDPGDPMDESPLAWRDLCHADDREDVNTVWDEHMEFGWPVRATWRMRHRLGGYRWVLVRSVLRWAADGRPGRTISLFSDVTETHEAAVRHRALIEAIPDTIVRVDLEGIVLDARVGKNANERALFDQLKVGQSVADACGVAERMMALVTQAVNSQQTVLGEWEWESGDGKRYFDVQTTATEGEAVCVVRDVTSIKVLEQQRLQSQKLESIGQLAAGVAHEINTPLQFIGDNARFLQRGFDHMSKYSVACQEMIMSSGTPDEQKTLAKLRKRLRLDFIEEKGGDAVQSCISGVEQVAEIVAAMKEFSHPGSDTPVLSDLNHALKSTLKIARNEWKHVATVDWDLDPELPKVACYGGEINQTFLNIVVNASHALKDKFGGSQDGKIGIKTVTNGERVEIRITDNGPGIPERIRNRIFDPFFTTKEVGKGTGQGLSLARATIMNKHGGELLCDSVVGEGTTFVIRLPIEFSGPTSEESGQSSDGGK